MNTIFFKYVVVFIAAFIIALGYFFFLRASYSSTVVLYPTSTLNPQFFLEAGLRFGDEKELNELLEVLNSTEVASKVVLKLKAQGTCGFCSESMSESIRSVRGQVLIERSLNRSANVVVEDKDPAMAAYIANAFAEAAYEHMSTMVNERLKDQAAVVLPIYKAKQEEVIALQDTMKVLESLGDVKSTGMVVLKSPRYRLFETQFELELKKMVELKHQMEHLEGLIKKGLPRFFIVSSATPSTDLRILKMCLNAFLFAILSVLTLGVIRNKELFFNFSNKAS